MLVLTIGSAIIYAFATQTFQIADQPAGVVYPVQRLDSRYLTTASDFHYPPYVVKPLIEQQFRGIVKQAYDYSCGSAALTTLLNGYLNQNLTEQQTMNGLLKYGEYDRIVARRSFSLLDMKRFVTALGYDSGGFKGSFEDLVGMDKPVIVPISYAGFKHFVVYKTHQNGRVFVADPALGNLSFSDKHFKEVWDNNILFVIEPGNNATNNLLALQEHDMRFVDDALINEQALVQIMEPNLRMEQNADRAATMRRVLDAGVKEKEPTAGSTAPKPIPQAIETSMRLYFKRK